MVILNYTHPECHISTVFLHLSKQCLDEGGLASSNLTHHSHQLTWLHAKVNAVCDKVTTSPQLQIISSASFNELHSWKGSSHIHVHVNRLSIQWHSWNVEYCLSILLGKVWCQKYGYVDHSPGYIQVSTCIYVYM